MLAATRGSGPLRYVAAPGALRTGFANGLTFRAVAEPAALFTVIVTVKIPPTGLAVGATRMPAVRLVASCTVASELVMAAVVVTWPELKSVVVAWAVRVKAPAPTAE